MFGLVLMLEVNLLLSCLTWLAAQEVYNPQLVTDVSEAKRAWSWLQEICVTADAIIRVGFTFESAVHGRPNPMVSQSHSNCP